jgi:hypothetical protein
LLGVDQLAPKVDAFVRKLPAGYGCDRGSVEESAKSQAPIEAVVPLMLFIMATILMIQLQSFHCGRLRRLHFMLRASADTLRWPRPAISLLLAQPRMFLVAP